MNNDMNLLRRDCAMQRAWIEEARALLRDAGQGHLIELIDRRANRRPEEMSYRDRCIAEALYLDGRGRPGDQARAAQLREQAFRGVA